MTETHVPRVAEAILESFGADAEFRDAIIGDLAQEHAQRVERLGATAARLWYYRQALLASPALLRNWLSSARWSDAMRLLNVAGLAYVMTTLANALVFLGSATVGSRFLSKPAVSTLVTVEALAAVVVGPILAGYLAATFEEEKPMIAALSLAFVGTVFQLLAAIYASLATNARLDIPIIARVVMFPVLMTLCTLGGVLRVRRVKALRAAAASSTPS